MSYILDALKKSEKERAVGNIPSLGPAGHAHDNYVLMKWALGIISVIAVAAILYIVWSVTVDDPAQPAPSATVSGLAAAPQTRADAPARSGMVQATPVQTPAEPPPVPYADLDADYRAGLPPLVLNVVSFSGARDKRFVMINQDIVKEGQEAASGVAVREIHENGAVLTYKGRSFFLTPN